MPDEQTLTPYATSLTPVSEEPFRHEGRYAGQADGERYVIRWDGEPEWPRRGRDVGRRPRIVIEAASEEFALRVLETISSASTVFGGGWLDEDGLAVVPLPPDGLDRQAEAALGEWGQGCLGKAARLAAWVLDHESRRAEYAVHRLMVSRSLHSVTSVDMDPSSHHETAERLGQRVGSVRARVERATAIVAAYGAIEELGLDPKCFRDKGEQDTAIPGTDTLKPEIKERMDAKLAEMGISPEDRICWFWRTPDEAYERVKRLPTGLPTPWVDTQPPRDPAQIAADRQRAVEALKAGDEMAVDRLIVLFAEARAADLPPVRDVYLDYPHAISYASWLRSVLGAHSIADQRRAEILSSYHVENVQQLVANLLAVWSGLWKHPPAG
ncbi:hypothetical protein [Azospirillum ramasamyi]|nr:hypothetical protein [Azospirillum ramasamyi]